MHSLRRSESTLRDAPAADGAADTVALRKRNRTPVMSRKCSRKAVGVGGGKKAAAAVAAAAKAVEAAARLLENVDGMVGRTMAVRVRGYGVYRCTVEGRAVAGRGGNDDGGAGDHDGGFWLTFRQEHSDGDVTEYRECTPRSTPPKTHFADLRSQLNWLLELGLMSASALHI